jgi:phosphoglycerate kinase
MNKLSIKDLSLHGKTVLMRVDFNVPQSKNGRITDDSRIQAALPSIRWILQQGAKLVLMSHLGKVDGEIDPTYTLAPCATRLSELLHQPVPLAPDCIGPVVESMVRQLAPGQLVLLENLRFHQGEQHPEKDPSFAASLARLGEIYINDAFGTAHRAHASTASIAKYFPGKAAAGLLMQKEISALSPLLHDPKRPFYAIIGGAKISTKIGLVEKLLSQVDALFLGGGMVYTVMKAENIEIGLSIWEESQLLAAEKIRTSSKVHLPIDLIIANGLDEKAATRIISYREGIPPGWQGVDIGPQTVAAWSSALPKAATCFWNGPLGVTEIPSFAMGTQKIAESLAHSSGTTIIGGGDSVAAIQHLGLANRFTHLSTGGGASLEFLEFGHLPGIDALSD